MKNLVLQRFEELAPRLNGFDAIIDVRSPSEYADDHIPGAINCPVLSDAERVHVGTLYKQDAFEAKKVGAAIAARNIAGYIDTLFHDKPREWTPLVYCWRGGNRSGSMAHIFAKIGWQVTQLDGGYKSYRHFVLHDLEKQPAGLRLFSVCGATGTGKSRLLRALEASGSQALDLEAIACHKGSVLGEMDSVPQPPQKLFESNLWAKLRSLDRSRPVYVESESKKIGNLRVPEILMLAMRQAPCIELRLAREDRIRLLLDEYDFFLHDPERLKANLRRLIKVHGNAVISEWEALVDGGNWDELVATLLDKHYDPAYATSIRRNYLRFGDARKLAIKGWSEEFFLEAARALRAEEKAGEPASSSI
ncbi:tRNA 2-selenouridine(34) synthase MnmH [Noviherbaspirillum galbum]|uniref:tRNA 2-selenouridine(34) synthase MnmH n=1 Tax=Noviherbaspirillum galbum TaxID=2709383 RepID=A0A6B3SSM7_9BURK|nr:tRNA 2-selenouridine(34) synthase MnmH [Noviherbaspirillum galbum]NEX63960.1 tRNA 2-selenouridine(34) synthase MnmH [Noviherbaspirillum galbum]